MQNDALVIQPNCVYEKDGRIEIVWDRPIINLLFDFITLRYHVPMAFKTIWIKPFQYSHENKFFKNNGCSTATVYGDISTTPNNSDSFKFSSVLDYNEYQWKAWDDK